MVPKREKILVVRHRYLGDTVLAIPALRNLRHAFPHARIEVLVEPISGEVLRNCPYIDELIFARMHKPKKPNPAVPVGLWQISRMLRARRYDRAYVLRRAFSAALLPWLAGIPHRVGFSFGGAWLLHSRSTPFHKHHEAECFMDVIRADDIQISDTRNENWTTPREEELVASLLPPTGRRRAYLFAKSTVDWKDWSAGNFAEVCTHLIRNHGLEIHACDAPSNAPYYAGIAASLPADCQPFFQDWSTRLSLVESGALIRSCSLALGVDTGLMHIAASFGVPVVALFGNPDPARWHPWGVQHRILRPADCSGERPLLAIQPAQFIAAVDDLLSAQAR